MKYIKIIQNLRQTYLEIHLIFMEFYVLFKIVALILADGHKILIELREAMNFYQMILSFVHSKELQLHNVYDTLRHDTAL